MTETAEIIDAYKLYMEVKYQYHFNKYCSLLKNQPESAKAEAVVFSILRTVFDDVIIAEDISTGGADFLCVTDNSEFIVEVTCLQAESVTNQSGLENKISDDDKVTWFSMITHKLFTKACTKARQVSGKEIPRLLVITTEHIYGEALIGSHAAEYLLTSETKIQIPVGKPINECGSSTDLKDSVFFRFKDMVFEPRRRSISAILLIHILSDKCYMVGILHPDPAFVFPIKLLSNIPFIRLKKWPPENNKIETEWVIHSPSRAKFYYHPVKFKDTELRNK
jgi:hypothetical protein